MNEHAIATNSIENHEGKEKKNNPRKDNDGMIRKKYLCFRFEFFAIDIREKDESEACKDWECEPTEVSSMDIESGEGSWSVFPRKKHP